MKFLVSICLFAFIGYSQASYYAGPVAGTLVGPGNPGAVLKGPAAGGTVIGPDGSHISGSAQAGALTAAPIPGGVVSGHATPGHISLGAPALLAAPVAYAAPAPALVVAGGYGGYAGGYGGLGLGLGLGGGHEGQYIPDYTEKLYDDGSYKPGLYGDKY